MDDAFPSRLELARHIGAGEAIAALVDDTLIAPARDLTTRPSKGFRGRLLELGALLGGGGSSATLARAAAAIELLHAGSLAIDDVQDGSRVRRGRPSLHVLYGVAPAVCTGNWLYFFPLRLLKELDLTPDRELAAYRLYHEALERAHYGQALDLGVKVGRLDVTEVARVCDAAILLKTGAITALAMSLGALLGGTGGERLAAIDRFGARFGRALQYLDDLGNLHGRIGPEKRYEDLAQQKPTGVWALAATLLSATEYATFKRLATAAPLDDEPFVDWLRGTRFIQRASACVQTWMDESLQMVSTDLGLPRAAPALMELEQLGEVLLHAY